MLPDADKAKRLNDMKQKYINDDKFLKVSCETTLSIRLVQLSFIISGA